MSIMAPRQVGDRLFAAGIGGAGVVLKLDHDKPTVSVVWQEAADKDTRELFLRFRNSWLSAAKRYESWAPAAPAEIPQRRPPSFAPEPSTHDWRSRPNDARTDTTAERLGAA